MCALRSPIRAPAFILRFDATPISDTIDYPDGGLLRAAFPTERMEGVLAKLLRKMKRIARVRNHPIPERLT